MATEEHRPETNDPEMSELKVDGSARKELGVSGFDMSELEMSGDSIVVGESKRRSSQEKHHKEKTQRKASPPTPATDADFEFDLSGDIGGKKKKPAKKRPRKHRRKLQRLTRVSSA
jgi:hypothetical protein